MILLKSDNKKWDEQIKQLDEQNDEFLSEFERTEKKKYDEGKNKLYAVINRRTEQWKASEKEREKLRNIIEDTEVEYCIYREEELKCEEVILKAATD